ncbi:hypothetical protein [Acinetobacter sp. WZC-1]|uniref:hypothetical protein n=1 Tax=Acinetobacter sp. WZC-1 TaxID=3459034 RepID=UPI00403D5F58
MTLKREEWHKTFLKMIGTTGTITLLISVSALIIYVLMHQASHYFILQNLLISCSFISLSILILQTLRSMYHVFYLPLMDSCHQNYQKIIFFCCSFSMILIILSSFLISFSKMLNDYYR